MHAVSPEALPQRGVRGLDGACTLIGHTAAHGFLPASHGWQPDHAHAAYAYASSDSYVNCPAPGRACLRAVAYQASVVRSAGIVAVLQRPPKASDEQRPSHLGASQSCSKVDTVG